MITLAIIGIVAALTIPNLIINYKKKLVETRLTNFYSTFNNALKLASAEHGDYKYWNMYDALSSKEQLRMWNETYILPYIKVLKTEYKQVGYNPRIINYLLDGSVIIIGRESWFFYPEAKNFELGIKTESSGLQYEYPKSETSGIEWFTFNFNTIRGLYPFGSGLDENTLRNDKKIGCNTAATGEKAYCAGLIEFYGWKIPKDYPLKF